MEDRWERRCVPSEGRVRVRAVVELDEEGVLADVGGHALQLEGLEACPAEERRVCGGKLAEAFDDVVVQTRAHGVLFCGGDLA